MCFAVLAVCGAGPPQNICQGVDLNTYIDEGRISHVVNHVCLRFCRERGTEAVGGRCHLII